MQEISNDMTVLYVLGFHQLLNDSKGRYHRDLPEEISLPMSNLVGLCSTFETTFVWNRKKEWLSCLGWKPFLIQGNDSTASGCYDKQPIFSMLPSTPKRMIVGRTEANEPICFFTTVDNLVFFIRKDTNKAEENIMKGQIPGKWTYLSCTENEIYLVDVEGCIWTIQIKTLNLPPEPLFASTGSDSSIEFIKVCSGFHHSLGLTNSGKVYSWGSNTHGQLGLGYVSSKNINSLAWIESLEGIFIVDIACGGWHSVVVSREGDIYTFGWNQFGQLGYGEEAGELNPALPNVIDVDSADNRVKQLACGHSHTVIILENNRVMGCGWGKYGQLGVVENETTPYFQIMKRLEFPSDIPQGKELLLSCGPWSTILALTTSKDIKKNERPDS